MRLTDLSIRKLTPPSQGQRSYFDDALPGFGIRVSQGGTKSFVVMYGSKRQLKTLGRYPAISLADARREAKRVQGEVAYGRPLLLVEVEQISFAEARDRFLRDCVTRNRHNTVYGYRRLLTKHFAFEKLLSDVSRRDLMGIVSKLAQTPAEQKYAYVCVRTMLNWCVKQGYLDASPLPQMTFASNPRERMLSQSELIAVYRGAEAFSFPFGPLIKMLILTGQRRGEVAALEWDWIDKDERLISLPAAITKNKRDHTFPYGETAANLLSTMPRTDDRYLFPARTSTGTYFNGWSKTKKRFDAGLENVAPYTIHDLRRTFSSMHANIGTPIHVTEKILNHVSGSISGIAAVYNRHTYEREMRDAMDEYDGHIAQLLTM